MSPLLLSPSILDLFVAKSKTFSSLVSYEEQLRSGIHGLPSCISLRRSKENIKTFSLLTILGWAKRSA